MWARLLRAADPITLLESSLVSFTTTALLVILLMTALQAASVRDAGEQRALRAIRHDVDQAASAVERERIERIVHDDVLSALRAMHLGLENSRTSPARMAATALERLAQLDDPGTEDTAAADGAVLDGAVLDGAVLLNRVRTLVSELAPGTEVHAVIEGSPEIPAEAALAITQACGEALRNSVVHAPRDRVISRSVRVRLSSHRVEVTVSDDGDGFDLRRVPLHRLGIARSIIERMRELPGGDAVVRSAPGSGTTVTIGWRP